MPKFLLNRWHGLHIVWGFILLLAMCIVLSIYEWRLGVAGMILSGAVIYYTIVAERAFREQLSDYVSTLSHRVKRAGNEVIHELPIGILLYSEDKVIEWHNPFVSTMLDRESLIGSELHELFPVLKNMKEKDDDAVLELGGRTYRVLVKAEERLLYFTDITLYEELHKRYEDEKTVLGIVMMDNLDEVTQGMDEQTRSMMLANVTGEITEWASKNGMYLRRYANDRFLLIMNHIVLKQLTANRFEILDEVRDLTIEQKLPLTLSIGVASGRDSIIELGQLAQSSLDIVLGRGGDQAAVSDGERLTFYGGRSNAIEKRTRVRARVISHALRDIIKESDKIVIMGHRVPDMDSIGAAIGVWKAAQTYGKDSYIVLEGINPSIRRLMDEIKEHEHLSGAFIKPEQAMHLMTSRTLAVVVDTSKASMVAEPKLLTQTPRVVVIDHHRRGEEFFNDAVLVYMEPYASSTCELVTELLQYISDGLNMEVIETTALLAGIIVDTKSFSLRSGVRTFEAASFLRRNGADSALIQRLLKEDLDEYIQKSEIIKHAQVAYDHIAIAVGAPNNKYTQLLIAKVADTLMDMNDVKASFVLAERPDGLIGISARSSGEMNVQVAMERLGGGGHLTNAAAQLEGSLEEVRQQLMQVLNDMVTEEGLFE